MATTKLQRESFLNGLSESARVAVAALPVPRLDELLEQALQTAQAAWPTIEVDVEQFLPYLAGRVPSSDDAQKALSSLAAADLYLACACAAGSQRAIAALESHYFREIDHALGRLHANASLIDDVKQRVRQQLFVGDAPGIRNYSGSGQLRRWLRVIAVRALHRLRGQTRNEVAVEDQIIDALPDGGADPELLHLKQHYREAFRTAFAGAMAALSSEDRVLLRQHFVDGLSLDELAALLGSGQDTDLQSLFGDIDTDEIRTSFCNSDLTERNMDSSPWLGPAWCFEFSSSRCSGSSKSLRRGAHASLRSMTTKELSSCRTIGTAIHHHLPRRREAFVHRSSTPPKPHTFRRRTESFDSGGGYTREGGGEMCIVHPSFKRFVRPVSTKPSAISSIFVPDCASVIMPTSTVQLVARQSSFAVDGRSQLPVGIDGRDRTSITLPDRAGQRATGSGVVVLADSLRLSSVRTNSAIQAPHQGPVWSQYTNLSESSERQLKAGAPHRTGRAQSRHPALRFVVPRGG